MKFQRQLKEEVSVNLTPLIDVVFLLLIFFMVTTTFSRDTNLRINLPQADGQPSEANPEQIEIQVNQNGSYAVNGRALINTQLETLKRALAEVSGGNTNTELVITADANSTHQAVVTALDAVAQLGFTRLNIATRQPETEP
ncbi:MAG: biopolymer transporter ExbD [Pseudomonadales bacterium]|nr:biopolymer transporter ExbD [Pseudomonadales bacterium]